MDLALLEIFLVSMCLVLANHPALANVLERNAFQPKESFSSDVYNRLATLDWVFGTSPASEYYPEFLVPPTISSISPPTPQRSVTDQQVRVNGANFASGLTVTITFPGGGTGTLSGSQIQDRTSTSFTMLVTLNGTGSWCIRVNNPNGESSSNFCFNVVTAQTPTISSTSPTSPFSNSSNQNVNVSGSNFQAGMTVTVFFPGGGSGTLSGTQLQNVTPTSFTMVVTLNLTGTYGIRVNNPSGLNSSTFNFTVRPSISSVSPSSPCVRGVDQSVTINGTGFQSGLTVTLFFPGSGSTTLTGSQIQGLTSTSFTLVVTLNIQGTYSIRINSPSGAQSPTFNFSTQYCVNITSVSPASPAVSSSNQNVVVNGSGFVSGLSVTVSIPGGGSSTLSGSQIQNVTSTSFTMVVTLNVLGQYGIRVNNPNGNQSNLYSFNTQNPTPTITSVSPTSPCVRGSDQNVTVIGSNFQSGLTVTLFFPGSGSTTLSGSQIQSVTSASFTLVVTLNTQGSYGIRVNNPNGTQSSTFSLTTQFCVNIASTSPVSPQVANGDQNIVVSGSGFVSGLTVTIFFPGSGSGTLSGTQIQNLTPTSFTLVVTLNVVGQYGIRVNNPNGNQSNLFNFTTVAAAVPTVSSMNPASPLASNVDQNVVVNGTNFQPGLTVTLGFPGGGSGTLSGTQIQNVTSTSFTMRVTFGGSGNWNMRINNQNGGQSGQFNFTVLSNVQAPVILSISPGSPIVGSSDQDVIVTGSNFQQDLQVPVVFPGGGGTTLNGAQIQNVTPTSFIMRATLNSVGIWSIKVRNPDAGESASFPFTVSNGTNPTVNSINPATPVTSGADQNVLVSGINFQSGLKVNVTFPDGGVRTLQGSGQIQSVSATSFLMRVTLNGAGLWKMRVLNPDNSQSAQFPFSVNASGPAPTGLPTSVLSPVIGSRRIIPPGQHATDNVWEFNQHKSVLHSPGGGISLTNDTYAWDVNLYTSTSGNADVGKTVFATAPGQVVSFVGTPPGGSYGAVLIAHPNAANPVWFSGYLHLRNIRVAINQMVDPSTVLGDVGATGASNDHLHFAVYHGSNTRGNLQSFNVAINERSSAGPALPTIGSINPSTVNQGTTRTITVSGTNFDSTSFLEVRAPNGQSFPILPTAVVGRNDLSRITNVTSTSITADVPFMLSDTYEFSVINRSTNATSGDCVSTNCRIYSIPGSIKTPVILIPGVMGSRIDKRFGNSFLELFPTIPYSDARHLQLKESIGTGLPFDQRPIVATDIVREYLGGLGGNYYGTLIDTLTGPDAGYKLYSVDNPNQRTLANCDFSPRNENANLYVFPYDWRDGNEQSARDLKDFILCIKQRHSTVPNFKVNIVAHSQGGLVARRYILNGLYGSSPYVPYVDKLITLGTPWLGAPKFILALETGVVDGISEGFPKLMTQSVLKDIARYMPGPHELIPSRVYSDELRDTTLGDFPFGENGWDFNARNGIERMYDFTALERSLNRFNPPNTNILPGTNTDRFHNARYSLYGLPLQDNWTGEVSDISYYNFIGRNKGEYNTIGSVIATKEWYKDWLGIWKEKSYLKPVMTRGDSTVPEISSMRQSRNGNYLGSAIPKVFLDQNHSGLPNDARIISAIYCLFRGESSNVCLNQPSGGLTVEKADKLVDLPVYSLKILGAPMVTISDSFGNTTSPLSTSGDEGVATISTNVTGEDVLSAVIPSDQNYKVILRTSTSPLVITVSKTEGQNITMAVRYLDLSIPPDVLAQLEITPQGISSLKYDSDGNGTFDTQVNPTSSVTGTPAQDTEPPRLNVSETVEEGNSRVVLEGLDSGTGVQRIMYSIDGTTFEPYSSPLILNQAITPSIYVFADDNVFNRSGLVIHNLTASSEGFTVSGPSASSTGQVINATFSAPSGRPTDDWIGLFRVGTLNSAYVAKIYTNGLTTGSIQFTGPSEPGNYEFRYLLNDGFTSVVSSLPIAVTLPAAGPGDLDASFGAGGKITTSVGTGIDIAQAVGLQPDGKILAAGKANSDFAVVRYNADGSLDPTFGSNGRVITAVTASTDEAYDVAVQTDGKIIVAGVGNGDFAVVRYDTNGVLDPSFGTNGVTITPIGTSSFDQAEGVVIQSDGKIVAAGWGASDKFAVIRMNPTGGLDSTFGSNGKLITNLRGLAHSVAIQIDGKIVVGGETGVDVGQSTIPRFTLARFNEDGSTDVSFGTNGILVTPSNGENASSTYDLAIQPDGKIVAAGVDSNGSNPDTVVTRVNPNGSLDAGFGTGGTVLTRFSTFGGPEPGGRSVNLQRNGKIVVALTAFNGSVPPGEDFGLLRLNANGVVDSSFGLNGKAMTNICGNADRVHDSIIQPNGQIVVVGYCIGPAGDAASYDFALARYYGDPVRFTLFDYDGDGRSDLSVRRPADNNWYLLRGVAGYTVMTWGVNGDRMTPADYDGDGKTDVAVFRPSNGTWYIFMSHSQTFQTFGWGQDGDFPVPTDRDRDGKADLVVFRPSNNTWYTRYANGTFATTEFGVAGDKPLVGDFDADGIGDIALFRPSNTNWYILKSSLGFFIQTWGEAGDIPVPADFDGDGATDQGVFRPSTGQWFLSRTTDGFGSQNWGQAGDIPVAADYDGDGKADVAVFRPSNGTWYIVNSSTGQLIQQFGQAGDLPTQSAFLY